MDESDLPLYPEAIIGWRSWAVTGGRLTSLSFENKWPVGKEMKAKCSERSAHHKNVHRPPQQRCGCGVYALKSLKILRNSHYFGYECFGQVSLWGRIIEGDDGYRAEFAYPKAIYVTYLNYKLVEPLSVYGVPVMVFNPYTKKVVARGNR
jgi:hypothetical protein